MKDNRKLETLTLYNNELVGTIPSPISAEMSRIYLQVGVTVGACLHAQRSTLARICQSCTGLQGNRLAGWVPYRNASADDPVSIGCACSNVCVPACVRYLSDCFGPNMLDVWGLVLYR